LSLAVVVLCLVIASSPMALDHLSVHAPKNSWGIAAVSALVGMAASATWFTSWAISGRRQPAYVGVALAPAWLMAEFGNAYGSLAHHRPTGLVGVVPPLAALLLLRQARIGAEVDTAMRPWRLVVALLAGFALLLVGDIPLSRLAGTASFYTGLVVGAGLASAALWCVAAWISRQVDRRGRCWKRRGVGDDSGASRLAARLVLFPGSRDPLDRRGPSGRKGAAAKPPHGSRCVVTRNV
jgi:hypothetical protein